MNRYVLWFGPVLITAAGIALIVATASAQSIVSLVRTPERAITVPERNAAVTLLGTCWQGAIANVDDVQIDRGRGEEASLLRMLVKGTRQLTSQQAWDLVRSGEKVAAGRVAEDVKRCFVITPAQTAALTTLASTIWSGPLDTLQHLGIWREVGTGAIRVQALGLASLTQSEADALWTAGQPVIPVGAIE